MSDYKADAIEVLNGLEPVRRRPGMYTDTTRPNHLGQEVIDNSVDEALAGHARELIVILHPDQWRNNIRVRLVEVLVLGLVFVVVYGRSTSHAVAPVEVAAPTHVAEARRTA